MSDRLPAPGQRVHLAAGGGHYFNGSCAEKNHFVPNELLTEGAGA
ncbi:hypothetical protein [Comamonas kerstersii]